MFASQIQRVEGLGKYRIRFHLREGNSEFPYILAEYQHCIMQADTPARIGLNGIGTGPFKFVAECCAWSVVNVDFQLPDKITKPQAKG